MERKFGLAFTVVLLWTIVECKIKRQIANGYQISEQKLAPGPVYNLEDLSIPRASHDSNIQASIAVATQPVSIPRYHTNQQFQTVDASAQIPYTIQQIQQPYLSGIIANPSNKYNVNPAPIQYHGLPAYSNIYIPFNHLQQVPTMVNPNIYKPQPQQYRQKSQVPNPAPQVQQLQQPGLTNSVPLFQHHVYHPAHSSVQHGQQNIRQKPTPTPPTRPKIYRNFQPILPKPHAPVLEATTKRPIKQEMVVERQQKEDEQEEEEEEENTEDDDDDSSAQVEDEDDLRKYLRGKFKHDDDDDEEDERYHDDEDDDDRKSESSPGSSKISKQKYPTHIKNRQPYKFTSIFSEQSDPFYTEPYFANFKEFQKPKMAFKMYKYSKSSTNPSKKDRFEGNESENIPVIQHNQKTYEKQWIISSKTSSSSNE